MGNTIPDLTAKIKELFEYRKIPYLLSFLNPEKSKQFETQLVNLQKAIYFLDAYLESNWDLDQKRLKQKWKAIYSCLGDMGIQRDQAKEMLSHIRRYQKHEEQLRSALYPMRLNMEYYYHYKSCDVRLMRELIYKDCPAIENQIPLEAWRYFDLVTEVNDDVEDLFEDQFTINGNFLLLSVIVEGIDKSKTVFEVFLDQIESKFLRSEAIGKDYMRLRDWFSENLRQTKELLDHNLAILTKEENVSSPIFDT